MIKGKEQTVGVIAISLNIILFLLKFGVGMMSHSISLIADAFNNLTDFVSSILVFLGFHLSSRPADENHPFGHERYETISGLLMAVLMLVVGFEILESVFNVSPSHLISNNRWVLLVVLLSILLKGVLAIVYHRAEKAYKSDVFNAGFKDSIFDILISLSILLSIVVQYLFGFSIDRWVSGIIAIFIIVSALFMLKDFVNSLLGPRPDQELVNKIVDIVLQSKDVEGYHDLMVHEYGRKIKVATIHIEVDASFTLTEAHVIVDKIEKSVERDLGVQLIVHLDPIDKSLDALRDHVAMILESIEPSYSFHDLQLLDGVLEFDVVVSSECKESDEVIIAEIVEALDLGFKVDVRVDRFEYLLDDDIGGVL